MTATDPYDQFSYESIAFQDTHPRHLACLGRLFELPVASPANCRVLELGCATGGNLIPMAWYQSEASFLGIDLSANQIREGQSMIDRLGLTNVALRQGDILELGPELGSFDYIVAHGVYSWVPALVRERLLELSRSLLNPAGLLYLSFNALPGWRMRGMLRDILRFACQGIQGTGEKLDAAYAALTRLEKALGELQALSARYILEEIKYLRTAHPSYLLFEYLAEENHAFLFSDFLSDTGRHRLRYLCDTQLSFLFPSTFGSTVESALSDIADDMQLEQWLDFVSARNFRRCVLCRDDALPADELSLDAFAEFSFGCDLTPPPRVDLRRHKPASFRQPDGTPIEVEHPLSKALLLEMIERQPDLLHLQQLLPGAERRLLRAGAKPTEQTYDLCLMELFTLFSHRALSAAPDPENFRQSRDSLKPAATALARAQAAAGHSQVATARHSSLDLDGFALRVLHHLEGEHDLESITRLLLRDLETGALVPPDELKLRKWSKEILHKRFAENCREMVMRFSRQGILVPDTGHR